MINSIITIFKHSEYYLRYSEIMQERRKAVNDDKKTRAIWWLLA